MINKKLKITLKICIIIVITYTLSLLIFQKKDSKIFFENKNLIKNTIFYIDSIPKFRNDTQIYNFKIITHFAQHFWDYEDGFIFNENNIIKFKPKNQKFKQFNLFNFNLKIDSCENISFMYSRTIEDIINKNDSFYHEGHYYKYAKYYFTVNKKYKLLLEKIIYDTLIKDMVYKFRFKGYSLYTLNDDLVFFVSKKAGIIGAYASAPPDSFRDEYVEYIYYQAGNIYLKEGGYEKTSFGYRIK